MKILAFFGNLLLAIENNVLILPVQKPLFIQLWNTVMMQIFLFQCPLV